MKLTINVYNNDANDSINSCNTTLLENLNLTGNLRRNVRKYTNKNNKNSLEDSLKALKGGEDKK